MRLFAVHTESRFDDVQLPGEGSVSRNRPAIHLMIDIRGLSGIRTVSADGDYARPLARGCSRITIEGITHGRCRASAAE
jgi:hypothetical protein